MLYAYASEGDRLVRLDAEADPAAAIWIDLCRPEPEQVQRVSALGPQVPTLADMEEIEISNRLYSEAGHDYLTVVLTGAEPTGEQVVAPVTFILGERHLVTVRHHAPRPFQTFPDRADRSSTGCTTVPRLFVGLVEEIVARQADILEGAGRSLDDVARQVYAPEEKRQPDRLRACLREVGRLGELLARVRLGLLTIGRAMSYFDLVHGQKKGDATIRSAVKALMRDISALEVHADFLSSRVGLIADTTLGMINLEQAGTVKIMSVMAVIFLPPTVIASAYGMNFEHMPELSWPWGYPFAVGLMVGSVALTWALFRWKRML